VAGNRPVLAGGNSYYMLDGAQFVHRYAVRRRGRHLARQAKSATISVS